MVRHMPGYSSAAPNDSGSDASQDSAPPPPPAFPKVAMPPSSFGGNDSTAPCGVPGNPILLEEAVLFVLEVQHKQGVDRLPICDGDRATDVAAEFAARHDLPAQMVSAVARTLEAKAEDGGFTVDASGRMRRRHTLTLSLDIDMPDGGDGNGSGNGGVSIDTAEPTMADSALNAAAAAGFAADMAAALASGEQQGVVTERVNEIEERLSRSPASRRASDATAVVPGPVLANGRSLVGASQSDGRSTDDGDGSDDFDAVAAIDSPYAADDANGRDNGAFYESNDSREEQSIRPLQRSCSDGAFGNIDLATQPAADVRIWNRPEPADSLWPVQPQEVAVALARGRQAAAAGATAGRPPPRGSQSHEAIAPPLRPERGRQRVGIRGDPRGLSVSRSAYRRDGGGDDGSRSSFGGMGVVSGGGSIGGGSSIGFGRDGCSSSRTESARRGRKSARSGRAAGGSSSASGGAAVPADGQPWRGRRRDTSRADVRQQERSVERLHGAAAAIGRRRDIARQRRDAEEERAVEAMRSRPLDICSVSRELARRRVRSAERSGQFAGGCGGSYRGGTDSFGGSKAGSYGGPGGYRSTGGCSGGDGDDGGGGDSESFGCVRGISDGLRISRRCYNDPSDDGVGSRCCSGGGSVTAGERLYRAGQEEAERARRRRERAVVEKAEREAWEDWTCPRCGAVNRAVDGSCRNPKGMSGAAASDARPTSWVHTSAEQLALSISGDGPRGGTAMLRRCGQPRPELFRPTCVAAASFGGRDCTGRLGSAARGGGGRRRSGPVWEQLYRVRSAASGMGARATAAEIAATETFRPTLPRRSYWLAREYERSGAMSDDGGMQSRRRRSYRDVRNRSGGNVRRGGSAACGNARGGSGSICDGHNGDEGHGGEGARHDAAGTASDYRFGGRSGGSGDGGGGGGNTGGCLRSKSVGAGGGGKSRVELLYEDHAKLQQYRLARQQEILRQECTFRPDIGLSRAFSAPAIPAPGTAGGGGAAAAAAAAAATPAAAAGGVVDDGVADGGAGDDRGAAEATAAVAASSEQQTDAAHYGTGSAAAVLTFYAAGANGATAAAAAKGAEGASSDAFWLRLHTEYARHADRIEALRRRHAAEAEEKRQREDDALWLSPCRGRRASHGGGGGGSSGVDENRGRRGNASSHAVPAGDAGAVAVADGWTGGGAAGERAQRRRSRDTFVPRINKWPLPSSRDGSGSGGGSAARAFPPSPPSVNIHEKLLRAGQQAERRRQEQQKAGEGAIAERAASAHVGKRSQALLQKMRERQLSQAFRTLLASAEYTKLTDGGAMSDVAEVVGRIFDDGNDGADSGSSGSGGGGGGGGGWESMVLDATRADASLLAADLAPVTRSALNRWLRKESWLPNESSADFNTATAATTAGLGNPPPAGPRPLTLPAFLALMETELRTASVTGPTANVLARRRLPDTAAAEARRAARDAAETAELTFAPQIDRRSRQMAHDKGRDGSRPIEDVLAGEQRAAAARQRDLSARLRARELVECTHQPHFVTVPARPAAAGVQVTAAAAAAANAARNGTPAAAMALAAAMAAPVASADYVALAGYGVTARTAADAASAATATAGRAMPPAVTGTAAVVPPASAKTVTLATREVAHNNAHWKGFASGDGAVEAAGVAAPDASVAASAALTTAKPTAAVRPTSTVAGTVEAIVLAAIPAGETRDSDDVLLETAVSTEIPVVTLSKESPTAASIAMAASPPSVGAGKQPGAGAFPWRKGMNGDGGAGSPPPGESATMVGVLALFTAAAVPAAAAAAVEDGSIGSVTGPVSVGVGEIEGGSNDGVTHTPAAPAAASASTATEGRARLTGGRARQAEKAAWRRTSSPPPATPTSAVAGIAVATSAAALASAAVAAAAAAAAMAEVVAAAGIDSPRGSAGASSPRQPVARGLPRNDSWAQWMEPGADRGADAAPSLPLEELLIL
ncbi:unnamed protein product [Phaeothamnion confervicola]